MFNFIVNNVPAYDFALLGARAFAGTVMSKFRSNIYKGPALERLKN